ncbi:hypothetical protein [Ancylobacter polymorphus]|uniref:Uncharacterized protein n=1 Tax=Ancylobacter polymorphus TaxID=223390 RepID=A0A9E7CXC0_9HYPH|nr:hypothetical protein [Ancylobacter polymorphus]UOK72174.1 hypothetical protein K9D25_05495 [Ancylobacter polymorphus]
MQLLTFAQLNVFATALVVSAVLALLCFAIARALGYTRNALALLVCAAAFALLGFVTGSIMGHSRTPAVNAVLPAALTFLGGTLVYLIGTKGLREQVGTAGFVLCFALSLFIGTHFGARMRFDFDSALASPTVSRDRQLEIEAAQHIVDLQRMLNAAELLVLLNGIAREKGIDPVQLRDLSLRDRLAAKGAAASPAP